MATEDEVSRLVASVASALKPDVVLETGPYLGHTTRLLGKAAGMYGGRVVAVELDPFCAEATRRACDGLPVDVVEGNSLEVEWPDRVGLAFLDSGLSDVRRAELRRVAPLLTEGGVVVVHDTAPHLMGSGVLGELDVLGFAAVTLRSPRGVTVAQR